eukprot:scaffold1.g5841.t1
MIEWARANPEPSMRIVQAGQSFGRKLYNQAFWHLFMTTLFTQYAALLRFQPAPNTTDFHFRFRSAAWQAVQRDTDGCPH